MNLSGYFRSKWIYLFVIFIFALLIRVFDLTNFPGGFTRDEAFLGYNAFSILTTGRDISGNLFPLHLASFLYTPAGYSYFSIPTIAIFGLSEFSVRITSALFGALTVFPLYFLVLKLFKNKREFAVKVGLLSAFLLSFAPWHINLSRTGSVITLVVFFILFGSVLFFEWLDTKRRLLLIFSSVLFLISYFFYISPLTFIPLFLPLLLLTYWKSIKRTDRIFSIILYAILLIPVFLTFISPELSIRARSLSIANSSEVNLVLDEQIHRDGQQGTGVLVTRLFHNKFVVSGNIFIENYFNHLSYNFFFTDMAYPDRFRIPHAGLLYPVMLVFLIAGILALYRTRIGIVLVMWILLAPVGSSFASDDVPNMQRTLIMLPPILILVSVGLFSVWEILKKKAFKHIVFIIIFSIFSYEVLFYFHQYYNHGPSYNPWYRQDGYKELINKINNYKNEYKKVVVTNRESAPTIFLAFYNSYPAGSLQDALRISQIKDVDRVSFDKYEISQEECPLMNKTLPDGKIISTGEHNVLYVNSGLCKEDTLPKNFVKVDEIKRRDGSKVFELLTVD